MSSYRHTRQVRLAEVGEAGQARLSAAEVDVRSSGFAGEIEARYLAAAGIGTLRVSSAAHAAAARAMDAHVRVEDGGGAPNPLPPLVADLDPAARDVAEGALAALAAIRSLLEGADGAR